MSNTTAQQNKQKTKKKSANGWMDGGPLLSLSPSFLTHDTILPSVMVELRAGMKISRILACTSRGAGCDRKEGRTEGTNAAGVEENAEEEEEENESDGVETLRDAIAAECNANANANAAEE